MTKTQDTKVTETDIIASLTPLLDEYFCGKITAEGNKVIYVTQSGQTFQITVAQIQ